jgi:hypothetical protein
MGSSSIKSLRRRLHLKHHGVCPSSWLSKGYQEGMTGKVSANPWQDENNGTPRHHGVESDWAKCSTHA